MPAIRLPVESCDGFVRWKQSDTSFPDCEIQARKATVSAV